VDLSGGNQCDVEFRDCRLANVAGSVVDDRRDDILAPTGGTLSTADLRLFLTAVGSEEQFTKFYTSVAGFRKLADRVILAGSIRLGVGVSFGSTTHVPLTERFFMGGDTTLRGFKTDEAGPLQAVSDPNSTYNPSLPDYEISPNGGELSILLNGELRFPVWRYVGGVLFYDYGNVFLDSSEFRWSGTEVLSTAKFGAPGAVFIQDGFRRVLGTGVRIDTPLGPVRLEYGRKLDRRYGAVFCGFCDPGKRYIHRNESPYEIFLSVGQAF
jgi:outer membrane protein assembly factor BamA